VVFNKIQLIVFKNATKIIIIIDAATKENPHV
jgi:hypothetical protein